MVETEVQPLEKTGTSVGIDVGLNAFAVLSKGEPYANPKFFRNLEKKLAKEQRKLSRRKERALKDGRQLPESKNYQKQRVKVASIHESIKNKRMDYLHKVSTEIVKNHDIIGIEDLLVKNMVLNRKLAKSISDVSWAAFRRLLEYKAKWYGKEVVAVSRDFPSSQLCSACGCQNKAVKELAVREWGCPACHAQHDRDLNASINIEKEALRLSASPTVGTTGIA